MLTQSLPPSQSQVGAALWGLWGLQGVMDRPSLLWEFLAAPLLPGSGTHTAQCHSGFLVWVVVIFPLLNMFNFIPLVSEVLKDLYTCDDTLL